MNLDFHTHGKLAKYLPFSPEYTDWLLGEAKKAGLDAICLTEHFNTKQFDEPVSYTHLDVYKRQDEGLLEKMPPCETEKGEGDGRIGKRRAELSDRIELARKVRGMMEA